MHILVNHCIALSVLFIKELLIYRAQILVTETRGEQIFMLFKFKKIHNHAPIFVPKSYIKWN